jgi:hypothetical protein
MATETIREAAARFGLRAEDVPGHDKGAPPCQWLFDGGRKVGCVWQSSWSQRWNASEHVSEFYDARHFETLTEAVQHVARAAGRDLPPHHSTKFLGAYPDSFAA